MIFDILDTNSKKGKELEKPIRICFLYFGNFMSSSNSTNLSFTLCYAPVKENKYTFTIKQILKYSVKFWNLQIRFDMWNLQIRLDWLYLWDIMKSPTSLTSSSADICGIPFSSTWMIDPEGSEEYNVEIYITQALNTWIGSDGQIKIHYSYWDVHV